MDFEKLKAPFPAKEINWRVGKTTKDKKRGLALAYIDSRAVMDRLDNIVSPENWQRKHDFGPDGEVLCSIGIKINDEWIWKSDGAAHTNFEAEKGGLSDAFKRAGVSWGIGRYLYNLPAVWADLDKYKNIKKTPNLPSWALPKSDKNKTMVSKQTVTEIKKLMEKDEYAVKIAKRVLKENNLTKYAWKGLDRLDMETGKELLAEIKSDSK